MRCARARNADTSADQLRRGGTCRSGYRACGRLAPGVVDLDRAVVDVNLVLQIKEGRPPEVLWRGGFRRCAEPGNRAGRAPGSTGRASGGASYSATLGSILETATRAAPGSCAGAAPYEWRMHRFPAAFAGSANRDRRKVMSVGQARLRDSGRRLHLRATSCRSSRLRRWKTGRPVLEHSSAAKGVRFQSAFDHLERLAISGTKWISASDSCGSAPRRGEDVHRGG